ncbi:sigma-70 family RNA polymerase sigma factor [Patescibacteria group bacterium]|nr:sigma-70 family RNA polymerase sigma factor [Patescibacteria group bacterium]
MESTEKTDGQLVELSLKNKDFFAYLIDRYEDKIFRYVKRITNVREDDLYDILQDIFIKVYENLNGYDSDLSFSSWIYRIAHNQVIDNHRKDKARPHGNSIDVDEAVLQNIANDFDILKEASLEYNKKYIEKALNSLDENNKEVLILRFFEEKDYKEISDILKKPMGTVATLINRAKKQFKENYKQYVQNI